MPDTTQTQSQSQMQIIGLGGPPAVGKTSLTKRLLARCGACHAFEYGRVRGQRYPDPDDELLVLGSYTGETFDGTDALAMDAVTDAETLITELGASPDYAGWTVLFEGDRLYNQRFLDACIDAAGEPNCHFYILDAPDHVLDTRHRQRGSDDMDAAWLKGRRTKYRNLAADNPALIELRPSQFAADQDDLLAELAPLALDGADTDAAD